MVGTPGKIEDENENDDENEEDEMQTWPYLRMRALGSGAGPPAPHRSRLCFWLLGDAGHVGATAQREGC